VVDIFFHVAVDEIAAALAKGDVRLVVVRADASPVPQRLREWGLAAVLLERHFFYTFIRVRRRAKYSPSLYYLLFLSAALLISLLLIAIFPPFFLLCTLFPPFCPFFISLYFLVAFCFFSSCPYFHFFAALSFFFSPSFCIL
jgi:hypothetical protein